MGSGALQITISLFAILGAAGLALVCDYLRHRNEELKAAMLAMRPGPIVASSVPKPAPAPVAHLHTKKKTFQPTPAEVAPAPKPALDQPEVRAEISETDVETEGADGLAVQTIAAPSRRPRRRHPVEADTVKTGRRETETGRAAFIERAMTVAADIATREEEVAANDEPTLVVEEKVVVAELVAEAAAVKEEPKNSVVPVMQQMSTEIAMKDWLSRRASARMGLRQTGVLPEKNKPEVSIAAPVAEIAFRTAEPAGIHVDHKLWAFVLPDEPKLTLVPQTSRPSSDAAAAATPGVQDGTILSRLLTDHQPYTGLVICISVKDMEERVINSKVTPLLTELAGPGELLCRTSKEEFVLLCPSERGSDSRRRLGSISHQLWDHQLRNLSNFSVLFSWGSENAWRARLSDALAAARDNMAMSRRKSEVGSVARRKAV